MISKALKVMIPIWNMYQTQRLLPKKPTLACEQNLQHVNVKLATLANNESVSPVLFTTCFAQNLLHTLVFFLWVTEERTRNGDFSKVELVNIRLTYLQTHLEDLNYAQSSLRIGGGFASGPSTRCQIPWKLRSHGQPFAYKMPPLRRQPCGLCSTIGFTEKDLCIRGPLQFTRVVQGHP